MYALLLLPSATFIRWRRVHAKEYLFRGSWFIIHQKVPPDFPILIPGNSLDEVKPTSYALMVLKPIFTFSFKWVLFLIFIKIFSNITCSRLSIRLVTFSSVSSIPGRLKCFLKRYFLVRFLLKWAKWKWIALRKGLYLQNDECPGNLSVFFVRNRHHCRVQDVIGSEEARL